MHPRNGQNTLLLQPLEQDLVLRHTLATRRARLIEHLDERLARGCDGRVAWAAGMDGREAAVGGSDDAVLLVEVEQWLRLRQQEGVILNLYAKSSTR